MSILTIYSDTIMTGVYNVYVSKGQVHDEYHVLTFDKVHVDLDMMDHVDIYDRVFEVNSSGFDEKLREAIISRYGDRHPYTLLIDKKTGIVSYE